MVPDDMPDPVEDFPGLLDWALRNQKDLIVLILTHSESPVKSGSSLLSEASVLQIRLIPDL